MGPIAYPETGVTNNLSWVTSQNIEYFMDLFSYLLRSRVFLMD
jgi:hypothetical protein